MMDDTGNFTGVAAKELERECDIVICDEELVDLTELAFGDSFRGMMPSVSSFALVPSPCRQSANHLRQKSARG